MEDFFWELPFVLVVVFGIFIAEGILYLLLKKQIPSGQLIFKILLHVLVALIGIVFLFYKIKS